MMEVLAAEKGESGENKNLPSTDMIAAAATVDTGDSDEQRERIALDLKACLHPLKWKQFAGWVTIIEASACLLIVWVCVCGNDYDGLPENPAIIKYRVI